MTDKKAGEVKLEIKLDEDIAQGVYANLTVVNHNQSEFVIDFIFIQPQSTQAKVRSRVVTSPRHVKRLIQVLADNLNVYENNFGPVDPDENRTESAEYH